MNAREEIEKAVASLALTVTSAHAFDKVIDHIRAILAAHDLVPVGYLIEFENKYGTQRTNPSAQNSPHSRSSPRQTSCFR